VSVMTIAELTVALDAAEADLFRIETLPSYDAAGTSGDFRRWLDGAAEPTWEIRRPWLDTITRWVNSGRSRRRVRVIHDPPSDYERYACDWGYTNNVSAGELVRVIDLAATQLPKELTLAASDWYLIDDRDAILMHYDTDHRFAGAQRVDVSRVGIYSNAARTAWEAAEEFTPWWERFSACHLIR